MRCNRFKNTLFHLLLVAHVPMWGADTVAVRTSPGSTAVTVGSGVTVAVDADLSLVNTSATPIDALTVVIGTGAAAGDILDVSGTLPTGVTKTYVTANQTLSFTATPSGSVTAGQWQSLLRTLTFRTTSQVAGPRTITIAIGGAKPYSVNGHFYEVITPGTAFNADGRVAWTQSLAAAAARPRLFGLTPYLATITTAGESTFVSQKVNEATWISGTDDATQLALAGVTWTAEADFYWATGPEKGQLISRRNRGQGSPPGPVTVTYANWATNEPNNSGTENFIQLLGNSLWNDLKDPSNSGTGVYSVRKYLVEYGGMPGDPAITLQDSRTVHVQFAAPVISGPASPQNAARPVVAGTTAKGEGPVQVRVTLDLTNDGVVDATYVVTAPTGGAWSLPTASATPVSGAMADLATATSLRITATTFNAGATWGSATAQAGPGAAALIVTDRTPPAAPSLEAPSSTADLTPTLTGQAEPGSTVRVSIDPDGAGPAPAVVLTTTADPVTGRWQVTPGTDLAASPVQQTATIAVTVQDALGNLSPSTTGTMTLDTTAPSAPVFVRPGASTGEAFPVITGTAEPGSVVTVTLDPDQDPATANQVVYRTTADPVTGAWTLATRLASPISGALPGAGIPSGSVIGLTAQAADALGNTSPTATSTCLIDTTAPTAPVFTGPTSPTPMAFPLITGTGEAGATVLVHVDVDGDPATTADVVAYDVPVDAGGRWAIDMSRVTPTSGSLGTAGFPSGQVVLATAWQRDGVGNAGPSATQQILIDTTPPDAPLLTGPPSPTNSTQPAVTGTAEPGSVVTIVIETTAGPVTLTTTADPLTGAWTVTPTAPLETVNGAIVVLSATARDAAGNTGPASQREILLDTVPPEPPTLRAPALVTALAQPVLSGTADTELSTGGSLEITIDPNGDGDLIDQVRFGPVTVASDGAWTLDLTTAIPQGGTTPFAGFADGATVGVYLAAIDAASNAAAGAGSFTVDLMPPAAPVFGNPTSPTADRTPVVGGTAEAGAVITLTVAGATYRTVADGTGAWAVDLATATPSSGTFPVSGLPEGPVALTAQATDQAGNTSLVADASVTIDTTAPIAPAITAIATDSGIAGDFLTNDGTLTINGTGEPLSTILVIVDHVLVGTTTVAGDGTWTFDASATTLTEGPHLLEAIASDAAGNRGPAGSRTVLIDTTTSAPVITGITSDTGTSTTDFLTRDADPVVQGTAEAGSTVTLRRDGLLVGTVTVGADGTWSVALPTLADGTSALVATVEDVAGNAATGTPSTLVIDRQIGTPALTSPTLVASATPLLVGTADPGVTVTVRMDGTVVGTVTAAGDGSWSLTAPTLTEGSHGIAIEAEDAAGNRAQTSTSFTVDTATTVPVILTIGEDTGRSAVDGVTTDTTPTITGQAEPGSTITLVREGVVLGTTIADGAGSWTITVPALTDGAGEVTATAQDPAGNSSATSVSMALTIDTTAPSAAVVLGLVEDTGVSGTDGITRDATIILQGMAEPGAWVTVAVGGSTVGTVQADGLGAWSLDLGGTVLADGPWTVTAQAVDLAGNRGPSSANFPVVIDTRLAVPSITGFSPDTGLVGDGRTGTGAVVLQGSAEPGATVTVTVDGGAPFTTTVDAEGQWTLDLTASPLSEGSHTVLVAATDAAGNTATGPVTTMTVDLTPPSAPQILAISQDTGASTTDFVTSEPRQTVSGTAEAGSTVTLSVHGVALGTVVADALTGAWSVDLTARPFEDGTFPLTAVATDAVGLTGPASALVNLVIDTTAPAGATLLGIGDDTGTPGDFRTADQTLTYDGTGQPGSVVTVLIGGVVIGTTTVEASGVWSLNQTAQTRDPGTWSVTWFATDPSGNRSDLGGPVDLVIDTTAPASPIVRGIDGDTGAPDGVTADATLRFLGTAEPGAIVTIRLDAVAIGTVTTALDGTWVLDHQATTLTDASYIVTAVAADAVGNLSGASAAFPLTVATASPAVPLLTGIAPDTGSSATDRRTANTTPTLLGLGTPGSTVTVALNGVLLGSAEVDGDGRWSFACATLPDGTFALTVQATAPTGLSSAVSAPVDLVIDTRLEPPVITAFGDDTGTVGDGITADGTLTLTGLAEPGAEVSLTRTAGGVAVAIGTVTADATGLWTLPPGTQAIGDGRWEFTATAVDGAGNRSLPSAALGVTVASGRPAVPRLTAIGNDTGSQPDDFITNDQTLVLTGTADPGVLVTVLQAGVAIGTARADDAGVWSLDLQDTVLPGGSYVFTCTATSPAGVSSGTGFPQTVQIDTDSEPTTAILTLDTDTNLIGDRVTADTSITLSGIAEPGATVALSGSGLTIPPVVADGTTGAWSVALTLADGVYALDVASVDIASNPSGPYGPFTITVDSLAPAAPVITAISQDTGTVGDFITSAASWVISGTAEPRSTVQVLIGGAYAGTAITDADGNWQVDATALAQIPADHQVTATAQDRAGNTSPEAVQTVTRLGAPTVPTILGFVTDTGLIGDGTTSHRSPTIHGAADPGAMITLREGGLVVATVTADADGHWSATLPAAMADGPRSLVAQTTDAAGSTAASAPAVVVIDTTTSAPTLAEPAGAASNAITEFAGIAEPGAAVVVTLDGLTLGTATAASDGTWRLVLTAPITAPGVHVLGLSAIDGSGNTATGTSEVQIRYPLPIAPAITGAIGHGRSLAPGGGTTDHAPQIQGTASPGAVVRLLADGVVVGTSTADAEGLWRMAPSPSLVADGTVRFTAQMINADGLAGPASGPWDLELLMERTVEIEPTSCGKGSFVGMILLGGLLAAFRGGARTRRLLPGLLLVVCPYAISAEEPALFRYGAKAPAPWVHSTPEPEVVRPTIPAGWEGRLIISTMPKPKQEASYLRGGTSPGDSTWNTSIRGDLQVLHHRAGAGPLLVLGGGLGFFRIRGDEEPDLATTATFDYQVDALPLDVVVGLRWPVAEVWSVELLALGGAGPTRVAIDAPATEAGNLRAASGTSYGLYTEYGLAATVERQILDGWRCGLQARALWGRHHVGFRRIETLNGEVTASDRYDVRLDQVGAGLGVVLTRDF